jgi:hypothetical protein
MVKIIAFGWLCLHKRTIETGQKGIHLHPFAEVCIVQFCVRILSLAKNLHTKFQISISIVFLCRHDHPNTIIFTIHCIKELLNYV